jgi:hypothetical protein
VRFLEAVPSLKARAALTTAYACRYFHVVFTVPAPVAEIAFQNKQAVYTILFRTAAETVRTIAADPKHLGAEIGLVAVLHTCADHRRRPPVFP